MTLGLHSLTGMDELPGLLILLLVGAGALLVLVTAIIVHGARHPRRRTAHAVAHPARAAAKTARKT